FGRCRQSLHEVGRRHQQGAGRPPGDAERAIALTQLLALVAIEERADVFQRLVRDVYQLAIPRLSEDVAPIVSVAPEFGVAERHVDAPEHGEAERIAASEDRDEDEDGVDRRVEAKMPAELRDRRIVPTAQL